MILFKKHWGGVTFLSACFIFITFSLWFGRGVRGSDQYWYVSDLILGQVTGRPRSNAIYPSALTSSLFGPESLPPPIHSVPATYLANYLNYLVQDAYLSWLFLNLFLAIASSILVYKIAVIYTNSNLALFAGALFLVSPQNLWLTLNPLMEQSVIFATLLVIYGSVTNDRKDFHFGLMIVGTAILVASRPNYLLIVVGVLGVLYLHRQKVRFSALRAAVYLLSSGALAYALGYLFSHYPTHGIRGALASNTSSVEPGVGNMGGFFSSPEFPSFAEILDKGLGNITSALLPSSVTDIILSFASIFFLILGSFLLKRNEFNAPLIVWSLTLLGIFFSTVFFFQFQNRYAATLVPLAIVVWVVLLHQRFLTNQHTRTGSQGKLLNAFSLILILFLVFASALIGMYYQASEQESQERIVFLSSEFKGEYGESIIFVTADIALQTEIGYSAIPSAVIFSLPKGGSDCINPDVIEAWNVQKVVVETSEEHSYGDEVFCESSQVSISWDRAITVPSNGSSAGRDQKLLVGWLNGNAHE